jgi:hypothetical protein
MDNRGNIVRRLITVFIGLASFGLLAALVFVRLGSWAP